MPTLIFVYGTLMRGYDHPMARHLADHADWLGAATCHGRLYRIAHYPGLKPSDDPADIVHGDVFALPDDGGVLLAGLDTYEGCGANDPPPHPYSRAIIDVMMVDGIAAQAWTYIYRRPVIELSYITNGRFIDSEPG